MSLKELVEGFQAGRESRSIITQLRLDDVDIHSPGGRSREDVQRLQELRTEEFNRPFTGYLALAVGRWVCGNPVTSGRNDSYLRDQGIFQTAPY
ncbi:hypothetical protein HYT52_02360 [Candidatus Woesearchaeota archaeon]|nr:hypothetical protein [Candidatus Woesearchaeota archaeon]